MRKIAILGYDTTNIGDDIQSFVTSTLVDPDYIILRDNHNIIYNYKTQERVDILEDEVVLIMNGWFAHSPDQSYNLNNLLFPINNKKIKPYFISTCLAKEAPELLEENNIKWYKENYPIFTRDNFTKDSLQKKGVDSKYFGCLTQLLDKKNLEKNDFYTKTYKDKEVFVDCAVNTYSTNYIVSNHHRKDLLMLNPVERIKKAKELLQIYASCKKIYTSRLHCFLPCRALGLNVEYVGNLDWRTKTLVENSPNVLEMKDIFYKNLEILKN